MIGRACVSLFLLSFAAPATAGVFTDDLSRCIVGKATDADKAVLVKWMFAAISKNPSLSGLSSLSEKERDVLNSNAGRLYERLILTDCRSEAVAAVKNEGLDSIGAAGEVLGSAAARQMMSSPEVDKELEKMGAGVSEEKWKAFAAEAGITVKD